MMHFITEMALRRRHRLLALIVLAVPLLAVAGSGVADRLTAGGLVDPGSESARAAAVLDEVFDAGPTNFVLLVEASEGRVEAPDNAAAGRAMTVAVAAHDGVDEVISFWTLEGVVPNLANPLRSIDGRTAIIAARIGGTDDEQRAVAASLSTITGRSSRFDVRAGGALEVSRQTSEQAERDLHTAELIALPLTLAVLLLVFRGWRAAILPLVVAVLAVLGTFVVLTLLTTVTDVSTFALNLTSALGLGLAIDYSLLIVARYRDEIALGRDGRAALHRTMQTAGRTVLYSGCTVAASMVALLVFPIAYLRSFAYAGVAVVFTACAATMIVAPTLLAIMGRRIGAARRSTRRGVWHAQTARVVRRPVPWMIAVIAMLLLLGAPFLGIRPGRIDDRVLPQSAPARSVADTVRSDFDPRVLDTAAVVAPDLRPVETELVGAIEQVIAGVDGVTRVDSALGTIAGGERRPAVVDPARFAAPTATWFSVTIDSPPDSARAEHTVRELRSALSRFDTPLLVGGTTASTVDAVAVVLDRLPLAIGVIAVVTLLLLFLMTGSVLVPVKALVLNVFSLAATFGALVWIFQEGHLAGVLGITATGRLDVFTPILMFCIAFGLSMDYEVFLLARIKEEYDLRGDNDRAVIEGIGHTGRLVTAAAVLLALVFVAISTSGVTVVKMFGVGLAIAVVTDAFAVRATLTPALMRLAGRRNWWAPRPLRRFHLRHGLWENDPPLLPDPLPAGSRAPTTVPTRPHDQLIHDRPIHDRPIHERGHDDADHDPAPRPRPSERAVDQQLSVPT